MCLWYERMVRRMDEWMVSGWNECDCVARAPCNTGSRLNCSQLLWSIYIYYDRSVWERPERDKRVKTGIKSDCFRLHRNQQHYIWRRPTCKEPAVVTEVKTAACQNRWEHQHVFSADAPVELWVHHPGRMFSLAVVVTMVALPSLWQQWALTGLSCIVQTSLSSLIQHRADNAGPLLWCWVPPTSHRRCWVPPTSHQRRWAPPTALGSSYITSTALGSSNIASTALGPSYSAGFPQHHIDSAGFPQHHIDSAGPLLRLWVPPTLHWRRWVPPT